MKTPEEKVDEIYDKFYGNTPVRTDLADIVMDQHLSWLNTIIAIELLVEVTNNDFWGECLRIAKLKS